MNGKNGMKGTGLWLRIREGFHAHPLASSLVLALLVRLLASWINYGPAAIDDYEKILEPALKKIQTGAAVDFSGGIRYEFFPHLFYLFMAPFSWLGIDSPRILVSIGYTLLSLISLVGVWGIHRLGGLYLEDRWRNHLTLISAVYFLSPLVMTKAYLGTFAIVTLPWAFYFLLKREGRFGDIFWGALLLALSTFFRYQIAMIFFIAFFYLLIVHQREGRSARFVAAFALGGLAVAVFTSLYDLYFGRYPLENVVAFLLRNIQSNVLNQNYGDAPWYNYIGILLVVFVPPFSFVIFWAMLKNLRKALLVAISVIVFVFVHSLIGNKLERFLFPIIPLFMLLSYIGIQNMYHSKWLRFSYWGFFVVNMVALPLTTIASSQMSVVKGALYMRQLEKPVYLKHYIPAWKPAYYGFDRPQLHSQFKKIDQLKGYIRQDGAEEFYIYHFLEMEPSWQEKLAQNGIACNKEKTFYPNPLEQLVIYANPEKNKRRRRTVLYRCSLKN